MSSSVNWPQPDLSLAAYIAPSAVVMGAVSIASGVSIWPTAVVRGDIEKIILGERCNVQDGAVIHCDPGEPTILEADVTVGHRAVIHSAHIEAGSLIGIGAIVLNGVRIGAGSIVGAGAVLTKNIPPRSLVVGVPGKVLREISETEANDLLEHANKYHQLASAHGGHGQDLGFVPHPPQI